MIQQHNLQRLKDVMSIAGRKGWSRVLKNEGWTESFTTLAKEL